jgi:hypothetical protein
MNKKALSKLGTFVMVVIIISFIFLVGSSIISRFLQSNNDQAFTLMVNKLNTEIDLMLNENAGSSNNINLNVPSSVNMLCFFDYDINGTIINPSYLPESIANRANAIKSSDDYPKDNFFVLLDQDDVRFFYVGAITVPTIVCNGVCDEDPYCLNASSNMELKLTSKGKKVLIE